MGTIVSDVDYGLAPKASDQALAALTPYYQEPLPEANIGFNTLG